MKILVTGGTGVVGKPAVDVLVERGHTVRLFSRNAERDAGLWARGVEARPGSIGSDADVRGAAEGCDAVLHAAGIVDEVPPESTFDNVNVLGTRRIVEEAARAGARRLVYVSSLGADTGESAYHRSKFAGERIAAEFPGSWLVLRPGNVYGAGDQVISLLLKLVRMLPVIPLVGGGDHVFQPVAAADLALALALALEGEEPAGQALDLAGEERVAIDDLLDLLERITDRHPQRVPIPAWMAMAGARLADVAGVDLPVNADQIRMLIEENVIAPGRPNALVEVFGITPIPLEEGLRELAQSLPEKLPSDGVGPLHRQSYRGDIINSDLDPDRLFEAIRTGFHDLLPEHLVELGSEPDAQGVVEEGATLTMAIPLRGHIQVRVEEVGPRGMTFVTVEGHHLAGVIHFGVRDLGRGRIRFQIRSYSRPADFVDSVGMAALGRRLQKETWESVVEAVVQRCNGTAPDGVREDARPLTDREAARVERWVERLVRRRKRSENDG